MTFEVGARLVMIGLATSISSMARASEQSAATSTQTDADSVLPLQAPAAGTAAPEAAPAAPRKAVKPSQPASAAGTESTGGESDAKKTEDSAQPPPPAEQAAPPAEQPPAAVDETAADPGFPVPAESTPAGAAAAPAGAVAPPQPAVTAAAPEAPVAQAAPDAAVPAETEGFQVGLVSERSKDAAVDEGSDETSTEDALPPGALPIPGGLSLSLSTSMSFGQSTFQTGSSYARDPMVDWSLSLSSSYMFSDGTRLSANASMSQELTDANGDDQPYTLIFSDLGLGASRPIYRFQNGPALFGSVSVQLPMSTASRVETLRASTGARITASQQFGGIAFSLGSGFRKNFHKYTVPTRDPRTGDRLQTRDGLVVEEVVTGIARTGGSELAGATYFDGESNNTSMIWSNSLSAFYQATDKLGLNISYNLSHSWTYESFPLDEYSGVGAREGRGRRDSHGGSLSANYQALDQLSLGAGMATGGPTRTADDKHIRFPFFNFYGPESNMTTFFISVTYTESIPL